MRYKITSIQVGLVVLCTVSFYLPSCFQAKNSDSSSGNLKLDSIVSEQVHDLQTAQKPSSNASNSLSDTEKRMISSGLVDIQLLDSSLRVDLRYAGSNNFLHANLYGNIQKAYLTNDCAKKLALAQTLLHQQRSDLNLLIWDAARPLSVQQRMWDTLDFPFEERTKYVSNPKNHSLHNYGCAVDLTLQDQEGNQIDMGTDFDAFDTLAQPEFERLCVQNKTLTLYQLENRKLLRSVMRKAGFTILNSEWWHFNCCSREVAKEKYVLVK